MSKPLTLLFTVVLTVLMINAVFGQKTDELYMMNGDRLTGEIKALEYGKLKYKTDHAGTIYVDWEDIVSLKSAHLFAITLSTGERWFGSIDSSLDTGYVIIAMPLASQKINLNNIVLIDPIKKTFWSRIDGNIEFGGSYTKASDVLQLNGSFNAEYKGRNFLTGYRSSTIVTTQPGKDDNRKYDVSVYGVRMYSGNWFAQVNVNGESNSELGLDWRVLSGGAGGHDFIRTVYSRFSGSIGLYYNGEKGGDSSKVTSSIEPAFSLSYKVIKYDVPKIDIYTAFNVFPSFTETDRVRMQYDLQTKFEIISDLYFSLSFYYTFDNKPRTAGAAKEDYGIIGSIGYKF
ncbi:MAG: hypothetical protein CL840_05055 [Crocinitomicaceae bacterium]|nr:hypothetical protein [Crocinitomicaceae bacterium]|tara:strand:- start:6358 stop:7389 length:1032 start_codon:yes stop_codon:yes gene_type:complete